jgi:hypothetical protein
MRVASQREIAGQCGKLLVGQQREQLSCPGEDGGTFMTNIVVLSALPAPAILGASGGPTLASYQQRTPFTALELF